MPRIVLCCAAGMSTSMLVNKMKTEAQQRALALEIYAVPVAEFERELPNADVILLGPQVRYQQDNWNLDANVAWRNHGGRSESDSLDRNPRVWVTAGYQF